MRVAILGAGRIGTFHATTLVEHPAVERVVIADTRQERAVELASHLGADAANTVADALDDVDACVIAASTDAHVALVQRAVAGGLPVFCEKPVAFELGPLLDLQARVRAAGVAMQVGFQRRFDAGFVEAARLLRAGELGRLRTIRLISADREPPHEGYIPTSGGIFRDMHVHDFDIFRWLTGEEIDEVFATGSALGDEAFDRHDDPGRTAITLRTAEGTLATLTGSRDNGGGYDVRMEVGGSLGTVAVGLDRRAPLWSSEALGPPDPKEPYEGFLDRFGPAYRAELSAFVEVVNGDRPSPCTLDDAIAALRVALAAGLSFAEGRAVKVGEVGE